jgi:four helix bundle protein
MREGNQTGAGGRGQGAGGDATRQNDDTFENLEVWREAIELAAAVYEAFRDCRDREFRSQIQAAAASISNNIAEGYERDSHTEFIRFLFIAKGSCGEVRSQAHLAKRVGLLEKDCAVVLVNDAKRLSKRIMRFIQVRREKFS